MKTHFRDTKKGIETVIRLIATSYYSVDKIPDFFHLWLICENE